MRLWLVAVLLVAAGFAGLIPPMLPGIPRVFAGPVLPFGALLKIALAFTMVGVFVLDRLLQAGRFRQATTRLFAVPYFPEEEE